MDETELISPAATPLQSASSSRMPRHIDYVLVYSKNKDERSEEYRQEVEHRQEFEKAMEAQGLQFTRIPLDKPDKDKVILIITCPFERLVAEAELLQLKMPLKGFANKKPKGSSHPCKALSRLIIGADDEVDSLGARIQLKKLPMFQGSDDPDTFFLSSVRSMLVYNILINLDIAHVKKTEHETAVTEDRPLKRRKGLLALLYSKPRAYIDAFVPNDRSAIDAFHKSLKKKSLDEYYSTIQHISPDPRRSLNHEWTKAWKFQPLNAIRDYYGEKIAFYFAWVGTYCTMLWLPAIMGLAIFIYGLYISAQSNWNRNLCWGNSLNATSAPCSGIQTAMSLTEDLLGLIRQSSDNVATPFFSFFICIWGELFVKMWLRKQSSLACKWDVEYHDAVEPDRAEWTPTKEEKDHLTGLPKLIFPLSKQLLRLLLSVLFIAVNVCGVFGSLMLIIYLKVYFKSYYNCPGTSQPSNSLMPTTSTAAASVSDATLCLLVSSIVPTLINTASILILAKFYRWVAGKLTAWENYRYQSEFDASLVLKLFAFNFVNSYTSLIYIAFFRPVQNQLETNGIFGLGSQYSDTCSQGTCMSILSFQVLVLLIVKPFMKFLTDIVLPLLKRSCVGRLVQRVIDCCGCTRCRHKGRVADSPGLSRTALVDDKESEHSIPAADSEDRFLQREYNKAKETDFTLDEFMDKTIQYGYVVMFASSFPLAPLIALILNLTDIRLDAKRLLWLDRRPLSVVQADIGIWLSIIRFMNFVGVISNAFIIAYTSSFALDLLAVGNVAGETRLVIVVLFEHLLFALIFVIYAVIPNVPSHIRLAMRMEKAYVRQLMQQDIVERVKTARQAGGAAENGEARRNHLS